MKIQYRKLNVEEFEFREGFEPGGKDLATLPTAEVLAHSQYELFLDPGTFQCLRMLDTRRKVGLPTPCVTLLKSSLENKSYMKDLH